MANNDLEKFLAGSGLNRVWEKVFSLVKILTGDVDVSTKGTLQKQLDDVRAIANGRKQGKVFATTDDMKTWLKNSANAGLLNIGDNLYIVEKDVPDWWISGVLTTADSSTGYFYTIEPLEGPKIDLSSYDTAISKLNEDISTLSGKISSFDGTKSDIVSSGLGKAIGLTSSSTWTNIVNAIKGITNRGTNQYAGGVGQGTDYIALNKIPIGYYGPANGSWSPEIRTPKSNFGSATAAQVLSGATFTSTAGLKSTGSMKNWSKSIQTATTSIADQSKSCYRISNGNIEVVPAIGYWGMWDWNQSCIRVPIQSAVKYAKTTLTTSNNEYTFKNATNNNPEPRYFTSWDLNFPHKILSAKITIGNEVNMMSGDGYCTADGPIALAKTHPSWNTDRYFYFPSRFGGYKATVEIWYI